MYSHSQDLDHSSRLVGRAPLPSLCRHSATSTEGATFPMGATGPPAWTHKVGRGRLTGFAQWLARLLLKGCQPESRKRISKKPRDVAGGFNLATRACGRILGCRQLQGRRLCGHTSTPAVVAASNATQKSAAEQRFFCHSPSFATAPRPSSSYTRQHPSKQRVRRM